MTRTPHQRESFWVYFGRAAERIPLWCLLGVLVLEVFAVFLLESVR